MEKQKLFWEKNIEDFDSIYDKHPVNARKHSIIGKLTRPFIRKTIKRRLSYTLEFLNEIGVENKIFCDIGCGGGRLTVELLRRGAKVISIDVSENSLKVTKERIMNCIKRNYLKKEVLERVTLLQGDITTVELPSGDCAILLGVIEYIRNPGRVIRNISKKYNKVILTYPRKWHWKTPFRLLIEKVEGSHHYYFEPHFMDIIYKKYGYAEVVHRKKVGSGFIDLISKESIHEQ